MAEMLTTPAATALEILALALCGLAALARRRPALRGTTLLAVWAWSLVSLCTIAVVEVLIALAGGQPPADWVMPARLAAATSTFCPVVALLGAKRPQDRAWKFVVAALWPILSLPSVEWWLMGGVREIHPAQLGFLAILVGSGVMNGAATRFWAGSLLYGCGQMALLIPFFPPTQAWLSTAQSSLLGLALIVASWSLVAFGIPVARNTPGGLDRVWLDFRDAFGAVWVLRVMERMNAAAAMYGWPVTLAWGGFTGRENVAPALDVPPAVEESLRTLLRRFVSAAWVDERMGAVRPADPQPISIR